jgi:hypothetical protein
MFSCCKRLALDIYNFQHSPRILVADSAKSITKGFIRVFDLAFRIDCWAHYSFLAVARLMVTKWKEQYGESVVNNFIKYFSKQWLSPKRMGWFDHFKRN